MQQCAKQSFPQAKITRRCTRWWGKKKRHHSAEKAEAPQETLNIICTSLAVALQKHNVATMYVHA